MKRIICRQFQNNNNNNFYSTYHNKVLPNIFIRTIIRRCTFNSIKNDNISTQSQREQVKITCNNLQNELSSLLEDRQCLYRPSVLNSKLNPHREEIKNLFQYSNILNKENSNNSELNLNKILELREQWLNKEKEEDKENNNSILDFYNGLLFSTVIKTDADIQIILDIMRKYDKIEPNSDTYIAIMLSLIMERDNLKEKAGDIAFYYFGYAIKMNGENFITDKMWGTLFLVCTLVETVGKIVDQWWDLLIKTYDKLSKPLPFSAVHGALTWCSANRDIERVLRFFQIANKKGVSIIENDNLRYFIYSGGLTQKNNNPIIQIYQLKLLVKLIVTVKSIKMDGGLRETVIKDIRRLIDSKILQSASWGIINDLLSGLSMPSAMQLLKFRSLGSPNGDSDIPFSLWASLLRRCARDHYIDQAESVFLFIRKRFKLTSDEKSELVEIMMRMFATLPQPDYASTVSLFCEHVLHHPSSEPEVKPNTIMYNLLIRASDSRNTAMMTFLEACAAGIEMNEETFEAVINSSNNFATIGALSRKLPHDYQASKLDAQIYIPANVDAHLRREEAMKLRGKELVDSTGEVN